MEKSLGKTVYFFPLSFKDEHFEEYINSEEYQELLQTPEFETLSNSEKYKDLSSDIEFKYALSTDYSFNERLYFIRKIKKLISYFNTELAKSAQFKRATIEEDDNDDEGNLYDAEEETEEDYSNLKSETGGGYRTTKRRIKYNKKTKRRKNHKI